MWRRNHYQPDPQMGYQAYPEPIMDDRYLETIHEVESLYSRNSRRSSVAKTLPDLPFRAVPPMYDRESTYSTDPISPIAESFAQAPAAKPQETTRTPSTGPEPISPVSSKSTTPPAHNPDTDNSLVSPIDSHFPPSAQTAQRPSPTVSQIPKRLPLPVATISSDESTKIRKRWSHKASKEEETRWDAYSGEPTDAQRGQPSAFRAGGPASQQPQYPQLKERTRLILAGIKDRETAKKAPWGKEPPPVQDPMDNPIQRPAWRGASGRTQLVEPVKNTPEARTKPLILLQRRSQGADLPRISTEPSTIPNSTHDSSPTPTSIRRPPVTTNSSEESIKPVVPLKGRSTPRVLSPTQADNAASLDSPFHSPALARLNAYNPSLSPAPSATQDQAGDSPTLGSIRSFQDPHPASSNESLTERNQRPLEREPDTTSSWNTYATSTVDHFYQPPDSPTIQPDLTSSPTTMTDPNFMPSPIAVRKRVGGSGVRNYDNQNIVSPFSKINARKSSSSILRKAIGSAEKHRSVSLTSVTKSLPPTPVEIEATDKASSLEARLEDLTRRKRNNNKIIQELRESLKRNAIIYDSYKRREVEKMIINLNLELQEITNEEHEVGLRLHRVQRRRDKDDFYEKPTGLWIKRVTT
ncbi:hypothetical protein PV10_02857 [Exophiala mesophila]|uniref:Uncharacterized protein n=1 Tax=Exophiala mesophila TaxID=212818 RepID=A0A0D1Y3H4_EXOME|nr:uncharacterized protein PV10_02857 [Exophiala mesophila]KIV95176.1 hypothetical protein PV10_02857 [Exophiala mesophila]